MPIGINSPARNLFLLGSSGAQVVTNFFKQIDQASSGDFFHTPSEIRYTESDEKFILAGEADRSSPASEKFGWIEKRQEDGTQDWETQVSSTTGENTSLQALELDGSNLVAVGKTGGVPWIAKYTDGGVITWQSTTNSGDVEYTGVAVDSNSNYYACGSTPVSGEAQAFVEKFDSSGNPGWGKSAFMVGRDVVLNKVSANSRGQVVAVGYLEDDSADKGYIIKIDTNTGDVLWDRTLELNIPAANIELTGVDVDNNDEIYVCGNIKYDVVGQTIPPVDGFIAKYTAEGNLLWQSQSDYASGTSSAVYYEDITVDNTTKKPTTFGYVRYAVGDSGTLISRYDPDGDLSWRREIDEGNSFDPRHTSVDGDQSFIYLLFADTADSETYVYGKVSATGNGLGDFEYDDGTGTPLVQYITSSGPNGSDIGEKIGRLSDGSVRNDTSDLITYPFTANKILFDDLATQVSNKKRQMDSADSFEYSGSPAVRPADFQELNLLGSTGFVEGPNLITNGTFDNDINGWDGTGISLLHNSFTTTWDSGGHLSVNSNTNIGSYYGISQDVPTVNGKVYKISLDVVSVLFPGAIRVQDGNLGVNPLPTQTGLGFGTHEFYFTAGTQGFSKVFLGRDASSNGGNNVLVRYDNIKVCEVSVVDKSGKGNNGVVNGPTLNAAGYWEFDAEGEMITLSNVYALGTGDFTFEFWFRADSAGTGTWQYFFTNKETFGGPFTRIGIHNTTNQLRFYTEQTDQSNVQGLSVADVLDDTWHHAVFVRSGTGCDIYLDGALDNSVSCMGGDIGNAVDDWIIGAQSSSGLGRFNGDLGEFRFYPRVLTAAQVFQNYNATKTKYTGEPADIAPKIGPGIVYDSNLLLNYDFGNRATYDRAENLFKDNSFVDRVDYNSTTNGNWAFSPGPTSSTVGPNVISPVGDLTGGTIVYDGTDASAGGIAWAYKDTAASADQNQIQFADGDVVTYSVYAKIGSSNNAIKGIYLRTYSPETAHAFFLDSGTKAAGFNENTASPPAGISADILDVGNGWYRCSITMNVTANDEIGFQLYLTNAGGATGFNDASGAGDTIHAWGAQVERNSSAGRPIKTSGTAITAPTTVKNLSSSSYTGTINGATFNSAGYFEFDGTDDYIQLPTNSDLTFAGDFSYETWLWTDVQPGSNTIWSLPTPEGQTFQFTSLNSQQQLIYYSTQTGDQSFGPLANNTWAHYVITKSGNTLTGYLNGAQVWTNTPANSATHNFSGASIGYRTIPPANAFYWDGRMGEIRIYDDTLTASEVLQNYNATRAKYGV